MHRVRGISLRASVCVSLSGRLLRSRSRSCGNQRGAHRQERCITPIVLQRKQKMDTLEKKPSRITEVKKAENVVVRFSGDSGDGMQLTGTQFTDTSAYLGQDLSTFPEFPAEIRAPIGTVAGVSSF